MKLLRAVRRKKREGHLLLATALPGTLRATLRAYLEAYEAKCFSPATVAHRAQSLRVFCEWAEERGLLRPEEVGRSVLESYQRHLFFRRQKDGRPLCPSTQREYLGALKGYFRYLVRQRLLEANPAGELELPRSSKLLPRAVLSVAQVEAVLRVPDVGTPLGLRDRALMELLYATAMRRSEAAKLLVGAVHFEKGVVFIALGKGRKDRVVPIGERALHWLSRYLTEVRPQFATGEWAVGGPLFISETGSAFHPNRLTYLVSEYVRRANVGVKGGCHLFRHAAATLMLEGGADVRFVQEMLGHASLETTQRYTHVSITKLKAVYAATHPGARLAPSEGTQLLEALADEGDA